MLLERLWVRLDAVVVASLAGGLSSAAADCVLKFSGAEGLFQTRFALSSYGSISHVAIARRL